MVARAHPIPPIGGLDTASLTAWEGRISAVVYLQGCNFDCPACPRRHLVPLRDGLDELPYERVLEAIHRRRRWLDAIVIGGGEPTLHGGLGGFLALLREFGLPLRLRTNGSEPGRLRDLLDRGDLRGVELTLRGPLDPTYSVAAGAKVRLAAIYESIELLLHDPGLHEFRVPWLTHVVESEQVAAVVRMLSGARRVVLVPEPGSTRSVDELRRIGRETGLLVEHLVLAGRPQEDFGARARGRGALR